MKPTIAEETLEVFIGYMQDWTEDPDYTASAETSIDSLDLDELAEIEIQLALESHFEMESGIPDGVWDDWHTVGDAIRYMEAILAPRPVSTGDE